MLKHPNFAVEVVLTEEEEMQTFDPKARRGRGGWRRKGRHLLNVLDRYRLQSADELWALPEKNCRMNSRRQIWRQAWVSPRHWLNSWPTV